MHSFEYLYQVCHTLDISKEECVIAENDSSISKKVVAISVRIDIFSRIELSLQTSCHQELLITRMTFNSSLSCLMSKVSIKITINTSKWHERAKQCNGNSQISSHK